MVTTKILYMNAITAYTGWKIRQRFVRKYDFMRQCELKYSHVVDEWTHIYKYAINLRKQTMEFYIEWLIAHMYFLKCLIGFVLWLMRPIHAQLSTK